MLGGEVAILLRCRLEPREMNNKDVCTSRSYTGDIEEMNVVISESHDRLIVGRIETSFFNIRPGNSTGLGRGSEICEAEEIEFAGVGEGIENVCIVIKDGRVSTRRAAARSLGSP
jgi:hypothetical protein